MPKGGQNGHGRRHACTQLQLRTPLLAFVSPCTPCNAPAWPTPGPSMDAPAPAAAWQLQAAAAAAAHATNTSCGPAWMDAQLDERAARPRGSVLTLNKPRTSSQQSVASSGPLFYSNTDSSWVCARQTCKLVLMTQALRGVQCVHQRQRSCTDGGFGLPCRLEWYSACMLKWAMQLR